MYGLSEEIRAKYQTRAINHLPFVTVKAGSNTVGMGSW